MIWGLIPSWAKYDSFRFNTVNARVEGIESKSVYYSKPFRTQRCIVPATGFYEPDKIHYAKPPFPWHYFQLKDGELFGFAVLYDIWQDPTGKEIKSYTIITTQPNNLVGAVHNRMPVILQKEDEEAWVNPDLTEPEHLLPLLKQYPAEHMETWRVGDGAKNPRNDSAELIKPLKEAHGH
jgi:putative SOS response-associated peptidase YedK